MWIVNVPLHCIKRDTQRLPPAVLNHGYSRMKFLDIVSNLKHLKDLDLGYNPRMDICHCVAKNI